MTAHDALRMAGRDSRARRGVVDQAAAAVLLQAALDAERSTGGPAGEPVPPADRSTRVTGRRRRPGDEFAEERSWAPGEQPGGADGAEPPWPPAQPPGSRPGAEKRRAARQAFGRAAPGPGSRAAPAPAGRAAARRRQAAPPPPRQAPPPARRARAAPAGASAAGRRASRTSGTRGPGASGAPDGPFPRPAGRPPGRSASRTRRQAGYPGPRDRLPAARWPVTLLRTAGHRCSGRPVPRAAAGSQPGRLAGRPR